MSEYKPSKSELRSFCEGMDDLYSFARKIGPDLAIFPLRGAYPFSVMYEKIADLENESTPDFLLLPLGTYTDAHTKSEKGLTKPEKIEVVNNGLHEYFAAHPDAKKVILVDEVMNGGTILTHYRLINRHLRDNVPGAELIVCAVEHGQHAQTRAYERQADRHDFHRVMVESLFVMDREQYLPNVIKDGVFSVEIDEGKLQSILDEIERIR